MSAKVVEFAYSVGQKVKVVPLALPGYVEALCLDNQGLTYKVVYWSEGKRESQWLYDWEIEPAKEG
jgi:hypothetical protein